MTTTKLVSVDLENKPGMLGKATRALAGANVNIDAFFVDRNGRAEFATRDAAKAEQALKGAGLHPRSVEAFQVALPNKPGELARISEELGKAGVNIEESFGAAEGDRGMVFLAVKDVSKAQPILEGAQTTTPGARN